jgi:hypothetical protein
MSRGVVFIDRDGALIVRPPDGNVTLQNLRLLPDVVPALKALRKAGYELVMVAKHDGATEFLRELFASQGAPFESVVAVSDADIRIDGNRASGETWPQIARRLPTGRRAATVRCARVPSTGQQARQALPSSRCRAATGHSW